MAHSFTELDKAVTHVISLVSFVWLVFILVCPLMDKDKRLVEASWMERLMWGNLGLVLMGGPMLSKSSIQFSTDRWGCVPSLLFGWGQTMVGVMVVMVTSFQDFCLHCCIQCPWPRSMPLLTHASTRDSWTLKGKSGSVSCVDTAPFSWVLVHAQFCVCPPRVCFPQSCGSSVIKFHWPPKSNSLGILSSFARSPGWDICCGS